PDSRSTRTSRRPVPAGTGSACSATERAGDRAANGATGLELVGVAGHGCARPGTPGSLGRQHRRVIPGRADWRTGDLSVHGARTRFGRPAAVVGCARVAAPVPDLLPAGRRVLELAADARD